MQIKDSVVLITGANRGLGLAYARAALAAGAKKVYAAARDPKSVTLEGVHAIALDVTKPEQVEAAARRLRRRDAAHQQRRHLARLGPAVDGRAWKRRAPSSTPTSSASGPLSRAFAPVLAKNGGGAIVNVLSALSWISFPTVATYSASKSAAWSLSNGLRNELQAQGTQVVSVHVGYMDTDMASHVPGDKTSPDDVAKQTLAAVEAGLSRKCWPMRRPARSSRASSPSPPAYAAAR